MEVRPGYKMTEVGLIPEDWEAKCLGDVGEHLIGLTYKPSEVHEYGTLVLRSSNIQNDSLAFEDNVFVDCAIPDRIMVRPGDVLICVRNGSRELIGKAAYLDERTQGATFGAFMAVHRGRMGRLISYLFQSEILRRQVREHLGATINQITNKSLNSFWIPIPREKAEQLAITEALSDVDALLSALDRLIAKKRDLKQAAMQQLLTGKVRLPGFREEWEVKRLEELCTMKSGEGITSKDIDSVSTYPCYGGNGLRGYTTRHTHDGNYCLIGRVGALCGNLQQVSGQFFASEHAIVVTVFEDVDVNWLTLALGTLKLNGRAESSAQPVLTVSKLLPLELLAPKTRAEQNAIATAFSEMDTEIAALEQRKNKTKDIKQAMMQELLTGRIRLFQPEAAHA